MVNTEKESGLFILLQSMVMVLTIGLIVFTFGVRVMAVNGDSMLPTLQDHQPLILQRLGYTPEPGDIVVLAKPSFRDGAPIVKRVIAVGGQQVEIDYDASAVYVDGQALTEPYTLEPMEAIYPAQVIQVPTGSIFVLGDNRNHSGDSRDPTLGVVDTRYVLGQVLFAD